jgi:response regulator of citrate/malate metabolism
MITVLVVDDDFRVAQVHADFVGQIPGMKVVGHAHTAAAALDAVSRHHPDLVLLDIYLPDASGLRVLRRLRGMNEHRPDVMLLTAARDMPAVRTAMREGALHYLIKPVDFGTLRERLMRRGTRTTASLPGGVASPTAEQIVTVLREAHTDLSANEVAERVGISRATAQRYLSALARTDSVSLDLRYGSTGRPEHRYRLTT